MTGRADVSPGELRSILRSVSRSFFVSIRLLPKKLREPVELGYLLARATDTFADTAEVSLALRKETLRTLASVIQRSERPEKMADLVREFAPLQKNVAEQTLIQSLPQCLQALDRLTAADAADVRVVLDKITRAQMMDLDLFGGDGQIRALETVAQLEEYTYLIAGCVGEFWTHLCSRHLHDFATLPEGEMLELGKRYGVGLQLINILRDAPADLRVGRCYFPADELRTAGLEPSRILNDPEGFEPVAARWRDEANRGLEAGIQYVIALKNWRVRAATVLPALIGARTIALLRAAGPGAFRQKIKVPRAEVRGTIASVALSLAGRKKLNEMFRRASE